ncbi:MAG: Ribonuclease 3 [Parcubacteria group bacterium GW2011_GWC2_42_11]|nr:MAG: Ribonuclease 3 [Parcubacteria group bacterium GW2011_GWC2_42_11]
MDIEEIKHNIDTFSNKIGVTFTDPKLLYAAFTHRSFVNEHRGDYIEHNERLEFLGDAVLELVVTRFLFEKYPHKTEGDLTAYRAALVNTNTIGDAATRLQMNDCLFLSRGEAKDTGRARLYILADTFEAVIGAIYLDQGYDSAAHFIETNIFHLVEDVVSKRLWQDSKSLFQEKAQEHVSITPSYSIVSETGPDHDKQFTVGAYLGKEEVAQGKGRSKQEAEQMAALAALKAKAWV